MGRNLHAPVSGLRNGEANRCHWGYEPAEITRHGQPGSDTYSEGNHGRGRQVQQRMVPGLLERIRWLRHRQEHRHGNCTESTARADGR